MHTVPGGRVELGAQEIDYKELQVLIAKYYPDGIDNVRTTVPEAAAA